MAGDIRGAKSPKAFGGIAGSSATAIDGTGTANKLAKFTDANTIANSQITDNGATVVVDAAGDITLQAGGAAGTVHLVGFGTGEVIAESDFRATNLVRTPKVTTTGDLVVESTAGNLSVKATAGAATVSDKSVTGAKQVGVTTIINEVAVANVETVIVSRTIPANTLSVGDYFEFVCGFAQAGVNAASPTVRIRIGAVTLTGNIAASLVGGSGASAADSVFRGRVGIRTIGAAGTANGSLEHLKHGGTAGIAAKVAASVAVDTTVANLVEMTLISGNAANTYTGGPGYMTWLRAN